MAIERPTYRVLVPGRQHFDCQPLRGALSTADCAQRWETAPKGSACAGCPLGQLHHADHNPSSTAVQQVRLDTMCLRCGRADLRIIHVHGLCISCANRRLEVLHGRNGRGTRPHKFKLPRFGLEALVHMPDATTELRIGLGVDVAEALWRLLRELPEGATLGDVRRYNAWNAAAGQFEHVCQRCGTQGLILERTHAGKVQRHAWCCEGEPCGAGWQVAPVRMQAQALDADAAAVLLGMDTHPDPARDNYGRWVPTGYLCGHCNAWQLEGRQPAPQQPWQVRCMGCGAGSRLKNRLTSALT